MTATATDLPVRVSYNCRNGKHHRCLGTVAVYPLVEGRTLVPCTCTAEGCDHGPAGTHS